MKEVQGFRYGWFTPMRKAHEYARTLPEHHRVSFWLDIQKISMIRSRKALMVCLAALLVMFISILAGL